MTTDSSGPVVFHLDGGKKITVPAGQARAFIRNLRATLEEARRAGRDAKIEIFSAKDAVEFSQDRANKLVTDLQSALFLADKRAAANGRPIGSKIIEDAKGNPIGAEYVY